MEQPVCRALNRNLDIRKKRSHGCFEAKVFHLHASTHPGYFNSPTRTHTKSFVTNFLQQKAPPSTQPGAPKAGHSTRLVRLVQHLEHSIPRSTHHPHECRRYCTSTMYHPVCGARHRGQLNAPSLGVNMAAAGRFAFLGVALFNHTIREGRKLYTFPCTDSHAYAR